MEHQPGFEALRGRNVHTAWQLSQMIQQGFRLATYDENQHYLPDAPTLEARWGTLHRRAVQADGTIALHQLNAFKTLKLGLRLKAADAPNSIQISAWCQKSQRGHLTLTSRTLLLDLETKDHAYSWFEKYPAMQKARGMTTIWADLVASKSKTVDVSKDLPPLDAAEVLKDLEVPEQVVNFGDRKKAEPGVFYLQQVQRARIQSRVDLLDERRLSEGLRAMLARAAWAQLKHDPIEAPLKDWIQDTVDAYKDSGTVTKHLVYYSVTKNSKALPEKLRPIGAERALSLR
ncbi:MAG: hypothetical protein ACI9TH_002592 [Kiritimatiellia bacterium]